MSHQINFNPNAQVVFIGGGPVCLWTADQLKLLCPDVEIEVLEKYENYQRTHLLKLNTGAFKGCSADPRIQSIARDFVRDKNIRTNDIEARFETLAEDLGIRIHKNIEVTDPQTLLEKYPNVKVIVGSDGSHSVVRKKIFDNQLRVEGDLKYIVEVKYEIGKKGRKLGLKESLPAMKELGTLVQESYGTEKEGRIPVTLRLFVDQKVYQEMSGATFKHPYTFENEELIKSELLGQIKQWMEMKAERGEVVIEGSEKVTVTRLGIYASEEVVKTAHKVKWCLVGDAAFGVPFFRSMYTGLRSGTELAKRISGEIDPDSPYAKKISSISIDPLTKYSIFLKHLRNQEILIARIKSFFLTIAIWFIRHAPIFPTIISHWTDTERLKLQKA